MELVQPIIGLTKEQLKKYQNDPFWKSLRFFLRIFFKELYCKFFGIY